MLFMDSIDRIATVMPKLLFEYLYIAIVKYVGSEPAAPDKILKRCAKHSGLEEKKRSAYSK
jgi:hypothetical protein